ncbi:maleylacetoacetate isomerase [Aureobasidium sp. EXF-10728]|nr:maleylacetoacetate isomerase [Aureobasidium sp. EXF-10728]
MASLTLYGYYRSSCSARLRIALDLKAIEYKPVYVNLNNGEHLKDEYNAKNASRSVPTLMIDEAWCIPQSMAALEYLEEAYPKSTSLLPADAKSRADVRTLAEIIVTDTQPPTNDTLMKRAKSSGADHLAWAQFFTERGLKAFEALWNAEKFQVALEPFPTICKIYGALKEHPSFKRSHWQNQPDCPEELR